MIYIHILLPHEIGLFKLANCSVGPRLALVIVESLEPMVAPLYYSNVTV